jgi:peptidoglycan/xylan/chitin deacetylase (PgdA/CDA1 family)
MGLQRSFGWMREWAFVVVCGLLLMASAQAQQLAITFDDLPAHGPLPPGETRLGVANKVLKALKRAHVPPVYGFVNGMVVEEHPETGAVLSAWRAAGDPLGNHTWSHMNLNQHSLDQFEQDTQKNEGLLELQMKGADWHWFRFPFLAEGDSTTKQMGERVFLAEHGYRIAAVTMSFADYEWNEPYARCRAKHDANAIRWLESSYLKAAEQDIQAKQAMSQQLYGRDIPYVLLMHIGAFDARMLPRLLRLFKSKSFTFTTLDQAEKDPFYRFDVDPKLLPGPDTLEAAMGEKHLPLPAREDFAARLDKFCR